jgi:hypothetical protein
LGFAEALFAEEFEALARDFQADFLEFGPLQGDHAVGEIFVNGQLVEHLLAGRDDPVLRRLGVSRGEGEKEFVAVNAGCSDVCGVVGKRVGFIDEIAVREPLLVAAFFPFGEVLRLLPLCSERSATSWK